MSGASDFRALLALARGKHSEVNPRHRAVSISAGTCSSRRAKPRGRGAEHAFNRTGGCALSDVDSARRRVPAAFAYTHIYIAHPCANALFRPDLRSVRDEITLLRVTRQHLTALKAGLRLRTKFLSTVRFVGKAAVRAEGNGSMTAKRQQNGACYDSNLREILTHHGPKRKRYRAHEFVSSRAETRK